MIAITEIKKLCVDGTLNANTQSVSISPDDWRHLEIELRDHVPTVVSRWHQNITHVTPDLRFLRNDVLRRFPPAYSLFDNNDAAYFPIPPEPPHQPMARKAWDVLKRMYPDNRVPKLPPEKLAEMATVRDRTINGGTGSVFSRDAIRRALRLRD
jgi:hypothetical protein